MKAMTNTKTKEKVAQRLFVDENQEEYWQTKSRTIWKSHTGVKCVKIDNEWRTIVPIRPYVLAPAPSACFTVGPVYEVPRLPDQVAADRALFKVIERVEPLSFSNYERKLIMKLNNSATEQFEERVLDILFKNLQ